FSFDSRSVWLWASVRFEGNAAGHRFELAQLAPPRHQQEETKIEQRTHLRNALTHRRRRQNAQVAQDQEVDDEYGVKPLDQAWTVADRFHRAVVQPWQEEQDHNGTAH